MKLNVEFVNQFATFGAILAGFSMSIAYSVILHKDESNKANNTLIQFIGGSFLTSAVILVLGVFLAALVLSVHAANGLPDTPSPNVLKGANWTFYSTVIGLITMLIGIGVSGFIRSKCLGIVTLLLAILTFAFSILIYSLLA